jgi:hypothetical protein
LTKKFRDCKFTLSRRKSVEKIAIVKAGKRDRNLVTVSLFCVQVIQKVFCEGMVQYLDMKAEIVERLFPQATNGTSSTCCTPL